MPPRRRRHPIGRPDHPPHQPPQRRRAPSGPLPHAGSTQPRSPRFGPPEGERSRPGNRLLDVVHTPGQGGGQEGDQAAAVEGGVVAGHGQAAALRPGDDAERGLDGQVEAVEQGGGVPRVAVGDQEFGGRTRVPDFAAQPGPGHGDRLVQGRQPVVEPVGGLGQGGHGHHHPGRPPVGEPQQGELVGRGRGRQPNPPGPHPVARPRYSTVGEQTATRRATASRGRHHDRRAQCSANPRGCRE